MIKNFMNGLFWGSLAGAAAGLLFAPRSGNETREKLTRELNEAAELTQNLNTSLQNFKGALTEVKETTSSLLYPFISGTKQDVDDFTFQAEPRIKQIQEQLTKIQTELEELNQ